MKRITITLSDDIAEAFDAYMTESGAQNRSEAIRDLVRRAMLQRQNGPADAPCLGVVSYTVDQTTRNLGARLAQRRLDAHDRHVAALSVPLDHTTALEIEVLRGRLSDVSIASEALFLERGVAHGALSLIPVAPSKSPHVHDQENDHPHSHIHVQPSFIATTQDS
ncbi:nickel-responsive transcriptional regulator NikR [Maritimibacter alexandrii]|uniref:nickel-responsive transcriptional regulator NikR n=1 Tax=Maritimibacter alexandrii TaxID=2570355 RepID=UPI001108292A|nr:nickel-responsive transcriptional regulator NikR [Maritimibacter alexandrii]MBY5974584.1 nickel-responsive transcriptional regulator NikR [Ferrimonas balearica]